MSSLARKTRLDYLREAGDDLGVKVVVPGEEKGDDFEDLMELGKVIISTQGGMILGLNDSHAMEIALNKDFSYTRLLRSGVKVPDYHLIESKAASLSLVEIDRLVDDALNFIKNIGFPIILKPTSCSRSEGVFLIEDQWDLLATLPDLVEKYGRVLVQRYIDSNEYRVLMLRDEVLMAYRRECDGVCESSRDVGAYEVVESISNDNRSMLAKAMFAVGLDFAGIDVRVDSLSAESNQNSYILELNSFPLLDSPERLRGPDFVRDICSKLINFTLEKLNLK